MNKIKKYLAMLLTLVMTFTSISIMPLNVYAQETNNYTINTSKSDITDSVKVTNNGIYINNKYYSKTEFSKLLNNAVLVSKNQNNDYDYLFESKTAIAIPAVVTSTALEAMAGTWEIPGVGEVVITFGGAIIISGVVITAGNWVYNKVVNWAKTRTFNNSAEEALDNCDKNKQSHILHNNLHDHKFNKINKDPNWNNIKPVLLKVLKKGSERHVSGRVYIRSLVYKGYTVEVKFVKDAEGLIKYISTAYVK